MKKSRIIVPAVVLIFSFFLVLANRIIFKDDSQIEQEYGFLSLFSEVVAQVKTNYVEEIDPAEKFPGAFSGMLSSLDPFSAYLDVAKTKTYHAYRTGRYCDCGIYGTKVQDYFFITDVIPNSPAAQAGLKHGDIIKAVNNVSLYAGSFWEMYLSLLSPEPQNIQLTLLKKNYRDTQKIELQTRLMDLHSTVTPIQKDILLIRLTHFDAAAAALLKEKLTAYPGEPRRKNKSLKLIIDLRTYCNGDLESFRQITRLLVKNKIALTLQQKKRQEEIFPDVKDKKDKNELKYKAAVIINSSTRFYGELLAAILKNPGKGMARPPVTLIGRTTQGFIAQSIQFPLPDKSSALVTCGLFYLNGKPTASKGTEPDIVINQKDTDRIMDKCISIFERNEADAADDPGRQAKEKDNNGKKKGNPH